MRAVEDPIFEIVKIGSLADHPLSSLSTLIYIVAPLRSTTAITIEIFSYDLLLISKKGSVPLSPEMQKGVVIIPLGAYFQNYDSVNTLESTRNASTPLYNNNEFMNILRSAAFFTHLFPPL